MIVQIRSMETEYCTEKNKKLTTVYFTLFITAAYGLIAVGRKE